MRFLPIFLLLAACPPSKPVDTAEPTDISEDTSSEDTSSEETASEDTAVDDTAVDDTAAECAGDAEPCTFDEFGADNCCNGRHTCYPEGCYYTEP